VITAIKRGHIVASVALPPNLTTLFITLHIRFCRVLFVTTPPLHIYST
jgi:hypothetical protein